MRSAAGSTKTRATPASRRGPGTPRVAEPLGTRARSRRPISSSSASWWARSRAPRRRPSGREPTRAAFLASCPREIADHVPSTGKGMFDVRLEPPRLTLTVKVRFVPSGQWTADQLKGKLLAEFPDRVAQDGGVLEPGTFWRSGPARTVWISVLPVFRIVEPGEKEHVLIHGVPTSPRATRDQHHSTIDNQAARSPTSAAATTSSSDAARRGSGRRPPTKPATCSGSARSTSTAAPRARTSRPHLEAAERQLGAQGLPRADRERHVLRREALRAAFGDDVGGARTGGGALRPVESQAALAPQRGDEPLPLRAPSSGPAASR